MAQSIKTLINIQPATVDKMTERELRQAVSILASAANKRLARLSKSSGGEMSPAYQSAMKRAYTGVAGGKFGTKGKTRNQLRNEYKALTQFLQTKTGSVTSWQSYRKKIYDRIGGGFASVEDEKTFWSVYRKLQEMYPNLPNMRKGSTEAQTDLRRILNGKGADDIMRSINRAAGMDSDASEALTKKGVVFDISTGQYVNVGDTKNAENALKLMSLKVGADYGKETEYNPNDEFFEV